MRSDPPRRIVAPDFGRPLFFSVLSFAVAVMHLALPDWLDLDWIRLPVSETVEGDARSWESG